MQTSMLTFDPHRFSLPPMPWPLPPHCPLTTEAWSHPCVEREGNGERYPFPVDYGVWEASYKLPSGRKRVLVHFELKITHDHMVTKL